MLQDVEFGVYISELGRLRKIDASSVLSVRLRPVTSLSLLSPLKSPSGASRSLPRIRTQAVKDLVLVALQALEARQPQAQCALGVG